MSVKKKKMHPTPGSGHLFVEEFTVTLRMPPDVWRYLLEEVGPHIEKTDTNWREALPAEIELAVFMRYTALGR